MYDLLIIFCAKYLVYIIVAVALVYGALSQAYKQIGISAALSLALAFAVGKGLGLLWYDPLPFVQNGTTPLFAHAANNGFPSDHVLLCATIAAVVFVRSRRLGIVLGIGAALVGAARVLAGVHHPVDVLAAAAIAIVATAVVYVGMRWYAARQA